MKLHLLFFSIISFSAPVHAMQQEISEAKTDSNSNSSNTIPPMTKIHIHYLLAGSKNAELLTLVIPDTDIVQEGIEKIIAHSLARDVNNLKFTKLRETNKVLRKRKPSQQTITIFVQQ